MAILRICCYSTECACAAQRSGAGRIELCSAPKEGDLTPPLGVLRSVYQHISTPVNPIIHPRGGDSYYTEGKSAAMLGDVAMVRELGFLGLATGILDVDGNIGMPRMEKIMTAVGPLQVTFHRIFDMCANLLNALKKLADLGVARILTSGQESDVAQGLTKVMGLIAQPSALITMTGAGIRVSNLSLLLDAGVQEAHGSTGVWLASSVCYRNSGLSMSLDAQADEYSHCAIDGMATAEVRAIIAYHQAN